MKSHTPPSDHRLTRSTTVRGRLTLALALVAALSSSTLVVQQWRWSGQNPHKTLDYEKALLVINNKKELAVKRNAASVYLYVKVLKGIEAIAGFEKVAGPKYKKGLEAARLGISKKALGK